MLANLQPDSDIGGRKWVYVGSITCYAILNFVSKPRIMCMRIQD